MTDKGIEIIHLGLNCEAFVLVSPEDVEVFNRHYPRAMLPKKWSTLVVTMYHGDGEEFIIDIKIDEAAEDFISRNRSTSGALQTANKVRVDNGLDPLNPEAFIATLKESCKSMEDYLADANEERRANGEPEYTMQEFIDSRRGPTIQSTPPTQPDSDTYGFGKALEAMSYGRRVARRGWNGKEMFVESVSGAEAKLTNGCTVALEAFFVLRSPNARYNTWVPSVSDIMAHDWYAL